MSRLDEAMGRLGSGEPAVLVDEEHADACGLVAAADRVGPRVLERMKREGGAAMLWLGPTVSVAEAASYDHLGLERGRIDPHGVLARATMAEAAVDVVRLAGRHCAAVLTTVTLAGGLLANPLAAGSFALRHGLTLLSVQDVVAERLSRETIIEAVASARLPSIYADAPLEIRAFRSLIDGGEHLAMIHGPLKATPLVRLHSECLTGDALGSLRCDCGEQLRTSLRLIAEHDDGGLVLYLRGQEGRGIGLANKIRAYALQDEGRDTVEANIELGFPVDQRTYGIAMQMLRALGVARLKLLTNNPDKARSLERYGITVSERVPLRVGSNPYNAGYLDTKARKMGHDFGPSADEFLALPA